MSAAYVLEPFWLGYLVVLVICVGWAWRLSREAKRRDADTTEREIAPLLRSIERERGE
jgi:hypothetical protein